MPTSPYTGLTLAELLRIRAYIVGQLSGDVMQSTTVPGIGHTRKLDSADELERKLKLVNLELNRLDPDAYPLPDMIRRTQGNHATYQVK